MFPKQSTVINDTTSSGTHSNLTTPKKSVKPMQPYPVGLDTVVTTASTKSARSGQTKTSMEVVATESVTIVYGPVVSKDTVKVSTVPNEYELPITNVTIVARETSEKVDYSLVSTSTGVESMSAPSSPETGVSTGYMNRIETVATSKSQETVGSAFQNGETDAGQKSIELIGLIDESVIPEMSTDLESTRSTPFTPLENVTKLVGETNLVSPNSMQDQGVDEKQIDLTTGVATVEKMADRTATFNVEESPTEILGEKYTTEMSTQGEFGKNESLSVSDIDSVSAAVDTVQAVNNTTETSQQFESDTGLSSVPVGDKKVSTKAAKLTWKRATRSNKKIRNVLLNGISRIRFQENYGFDKHHFFSSQRMPVLRRNVRNRMQRHLQQ